MKNADWVVLLESSTYSVPIELIYIQDKVGVTCYMVQLQFVSIVVSDAIIPFLKGENYGKKEYFQDESERIKETV